MCKRNSTQKNKGSMRCVSETPQIKKEEEEEEKERKRKKKEKKKKEKKRGSTGCVRETPHRKIKQA